MGKLQNLLLTLSKEDDQGDLEKIDVALQVGGRNTLDRLRNHPQEITMRNQLRRMSQNMLQDVDQTLKCYFKDFSAKPKVYLFCGYVPDLPVLIT